MLLSSLKLEIFTATVSKDKQKTRTNNMCFTSQINKFASKQHCLHKLLLECR